MEINAFIDHLRAFFAQQFNTQVIWAFNIKLLSYLEIKNLLAN